MVVLAVLGTPLAFGQAITTFQGRPMVRIGEGGLKPGNLEHLSPDEAAKYQCVIHQNGDKYYWTSRENKELLRTTSGAFVTFMARDGSGYIRIINPTLKTAASLMSENANKFDYVEHLLMGLVTITYYGVTQ
jgi:hypothetical protein